MAIKPEYDTLLGEMRAKECAIEEFLEYIREKYCLNSDDQIDFRTGSIKRALTPTRVNSID